jgi:hypothetical protein
MSDGARAWYEGGVERHYASRGATYRNPHDAIVTRLIDQALTQLELLPVRALDLAAGSGEASEPLIRAGVEVQAVDPYTGQAYTDRIGRVCEALTFEQIALGAIDGRSYDLVVCSFAMHLCPASRLPALAMALRRVSERLWIISPHKRPVMQPAWGWRLDRTLSINRVHLRSYAVV